MNDEREKAIEAAIHLKYYHKVIHSLHITLHNCNFSFADAQ